MLRQVRILQPGVQNTVNQQIRIPADGRRKVAIVFRGQPEVSDVFRLIHGLPHTAQGYRVHQPFFRPLFHFRQRCLHIFGTHFPVFGNAQFHIKALQQFGQSFHLVFRRRLMDPVHAGPLEHGKMPRHRFVGRQHKLFNDRFRQSVDALFDFQRLAGFIQYDFLLRQVKLNGAPPGSLLL